jgi:hypothetical protein
VNEDDLAQTFADAAQTALNNYLGAEQKSPQSEYDRDRGGSEQSA